MEVAMQSYVAALPLSADQLVAILFARPVHAMPAQQDVFRSFGFLPVKRVFVVKDNSAMTLSRIICTQHMKAIARLPSAQSRC